MQSRNILVQRRFCVLSAQSWVSGTTLAIAPRSWQQPSVILKEKRKFEKEKPLNCKSANTKLSQPRGSSVPFCAYQKVDKSWEMQLWNGRTHRSRGSAVPFCFHEKPPLFI